MHAAKWMLGARTGFRTGRKVGRHMDIFWPPVLIGPVAIIIGVVAIKYRKGMASGIAEGQRTMFGKAGELIARQSKPSGVVVAGAGGILIGVVMILMGLFIPPEQW